VLETIFVAELSPAFSRVSYLWTRNIKPSLLKKDLSRSHNIERNCGGISDFVIAFSVILGKLLNILVARDGSFDSEHQAESSKKKSIPIG
jgi:hypothetical protein